MSSYTVNSAWKGHVRLAFGREFVDLGRTLSRLQKAAAATTTLTLVSKRHLEPPLDFPPPDHTAAVLGTLASMEALTSLGLDTVPDLARAVVRAAPRPLIALFLTLHPADFTVAEPFTPDDVREWARLELKQLSITAFPKWDLPAALAWSNAWITTDLPSCTLDMLGAEGLVCYENWILRHRAWCLRHKGYRKNMEGSALAKGPGFVTMRQIAKQIEAGRTELVDTRIVLECAAGSLYGYVARVSDVRLERTVTRVRGTPLQNLVNSTCAWGFMMLPSSSAREGEISVLVRGERLALDRTLEDYGVDGETTVEIHV